MSRPRWLALGFVLAALAISGSHGIAATPDLPGVLVSRQLLENRGLRVGDTILLAPARSGEHAREFRIQGPYEPTPDPMRFAQQRLEVRLHLPDLQALLANGRRGLDTASPDPEAVTSINVALKDPADAAAFARDLTSRVPGIVARPTDAPNERTSTFLVLERFHLAIAVVTVIGSAVFLLALMVMLVDERRSTVGILRLIGFTRRRILLQVFAEGALIAIAGAAFGILFALASQGLFNRFFQWRYDTSLVFLRITSDVVWRSVALAVPLGILASLIASWSLVRQQLLALLRR
jgi:putative ABC transport system permease protein